MRSVCRAMSASLLTQYILRSTGFPSSTRASQCCCSRGSWLRSSCVCSRLTSSSSLVMIPAWMRRSPGGSTCTGTCSASPPIRTSFVPLWAQARRSSTCRYLSLRWHWLAPSTHTTGGRCTPPSSCCMPLQPALQAMWQLLTTSRWMGSCGCATFCSPASSSADPFLVSLPSSTRWPLHTGPLRRFPLAPLWLSSSSGAWSPSPSQCLGASRARTTGLISWPPAAPTSTPVRCLSCLGTALPFPRCSWQASCPSQPSMLSSTTSLPACGDTRCTSSGPFYSLCTSFSSS
mmetsp:Transcript_12388/g.21907  ORF Transcript_12388/g.21907 Transcript_12388/m.21907 type:complete len:289 (-) Transcript_12388:2594-3460(-)